VVRFDDSLRTVLAADMAAGFGAQAAWRQLVDLAGRGRIVADAGTLDRLADLRGSVPVAVRAASARALAYARPDAALVGFFAEDELAIAAPVLRTASLPAAEWLAMLPRLSPVTRSVLRGRRDLPAEVSRGLESFGSTDFTLGYDAPPPAELDPVGSGPAAIAPVNPEPAAPAPPMMPAEAATVVPLVVAADRPMMPAAPLGPSPFVPLGEIARGLPVVAEALRRAEEPATDRFEIADIVARLDAFRRDRPGDPRPAPPLPVRADRFRLVTDAGGVIRWVEGAGRATLVGVCLARAGTQGLVGVDAGVAGALRQRARIEAGRLEVGGDGDLAGSWRLAAIPDFDADSGRFTGYAGTASRAARHQHAERAEAADGLRQLVHELRTPANAVAGFAEFIETELLGPVPPVYRDRAATIRGKANDLIAAIDDLDTAARIEADALDLHPRDVSLTALVRHVAGTLAPLAAERGATLAIAGEDVVVGIDERSAERLVARLLATTLAAAGPGERLSVATSTAGGEAVLTLDRPAAFAAWSDEALYALGDPDRSDDEAEGAPLLGTGFTLRLVRNLAREVGGALAIGRDRLTLRLPLALHRDMDRASTS